MFRSAGRAISQVSASIRIRYQEQSRSLATSNQGKKEGTIADAFASLSGQKFEALDPRFIAVKAELIKGNEDAVKASWDRLLLHLQEEVRTIQQLGSTVVPQIDFADIDSPSDHFSREYRKRGCAVIKGAIPQEEVLRMKEELKEYIKTNPSTKAFPADNPQVYELYWSPTQARARAHPRLLKAQQFLLSYWHSADPDALVSSKPISYADRLRMRQPGDAQFALGPHIDGGSCERWESSGYGRGKVYEQIWKGDWELYDPWETSCRLPVVSDLYEGQGSCSAFRMAQGWLSMSHTSAFEGTLLVNPLLQLATAYFLLRPFFTERNYPQISDTIANKEKLINDPAYLSPDNWKLEIPCSSWLHGANPGRGQELDPSLHPHLNLPTTMVHVPTVEPGDYVVWHCDSIHAVDNIHQGTTDSSVMYIPACPLTLQNSEYLVRQRGCFLNGLIGHPGLHRSSAHKVTGIPSPDFPGGKGESVHVGIANAVDISRFGGSEALRAMGLEQWNSEEHGRTAGEKEVMRRANKILGFNS